MKEITKMTKKELLNELAKMANYLQVIENKALAYKIVLNDLIENEDIEIGNDYQTKDPEQKKAEINLEYLKAFT